MTGIPDIIFDPAATIASLFHVERAGTWYLEYEINRGSVTDTRIFVANKERQILAGDIAFLPDAERLAGEFEARLRDAGWIAERIENSELLAANVVAAWNLRPA